jgi:glucose-6-phosphate 1-dehydrogenase
VKKLIEGLPYYRDKLHEKDVFERLSEILTKVSLSRNRRYLLLCVFNVPPGSFQQGCQQT